MENKTMNPICWFEIPVLDMARAVKFYEEVLGVKMTLLEGGFNGMEMAFFPDNYQTYGTSGALVKCDAAKPAKEGGTLIYFSSLAGDLAVELGRVEAAGGTVCVPKSLISEEIGSFGIFIDTEGNTLAFHSH